MTHWQNAYGLLRLATRIALGTLAGRRTVSLPERLSAFPRRLPLEAAVRINWSDQQIPFVEAASARDAAVALGAVHAHLRLAQMEIMRLIAYGRLSELLGPASVDLDHTLRIVDFPRAVPQLLPRLPEETRDWLDGFVAGVNRTIEQAPSLPEEFRLFGVEPEPWRVEHVLALGRLAALDFSWRVWHRLLPLRERSDWSALWERMAVEEHAPVPSLAGATGPAEALERLWGSLGRVGSNAAAVSAKRSGTGGALLTSDPHLSIMAPNNWLALGLAWPGHRVVGLAIPGLPVVALGRNEHIAWSGTSLHAASSDLFDVTDQPEGTVWTRRERIRVRWGRDRLCDLRETEHGPIVTDAPLLGARNRRGAVARDLALTWIGHGGSDEVTAMLGMMQARDWQEFTTAIEGFAAPAQNLIFADAEGRVGQAMAAHLPRRPAGRPNDLVLPADALGNWASTVTARDLPRRFEPDAGFVASANDRPLDTLPVPVGFFFSPDERVQRLRAALEARRDVQLADLRHLHRDVAMPSAPAIRDLLVAAIEAGAATGRARHRDLLRALRDWNGHHAADSAGALAFELLLHDFLHQLHGKDGMALYRGSLQPWDLLREDMATLPPPRIAEAARRAMRRAARTFARHRNWGDLHRLVLAHPLSALPVIGRRYRFCDLPVGGSNETLMKTAHGLSSKRHRVGFGANARFLADLGQPDETYVVLLGGQDGWLGSTTFADQLALWQRGDYCRLPLTRPCVRAEYRHEMLLEPSGRSRPDA
ncbi:MAG: penicillin acylase family protein [Tistlia sp.]|uniref:penicillin acylase family protein n=1 Tax=Tistlia sp. TaxID=3057121 RepID=UPI0034A1CD66